MIWSSALCISINKDSNKIYFIFSSISTYFFVFCMFILFSGIL
jgi:hypothetical protein